MRQFKFVCLAAMLGIATVPASGGRDPQAATPTFTRDVAPILYKNCTGCHRPKGLGPMSLLTYRDARGAASDIADAVDAGYMPPWHADAPRGTFHNDRRLTDAEKQTILRWIAGKTPQGNARDLPKAPEYPTSWTIGTPDAVITMPTSYKVPAKGVIEYQYFEVPTNFTEDKWVRAIEILPGAREVVHHVLVYARLPGPPPAPRPPGTPAPTPLLIQPPTQRSPPNPDAPDRQLGALIATTAPGTNLQTFPRGTALRLRAGTVITFQMHYTAHGEHEATDRTSVGMLFTNEPPAEEIRAGAFWNGQLRIPAGAVDHQVPAEVTFRDPVRIWGLFPHTHLRGKKWEYRLVKPDGTSQIILSVPRYDFNWQTYYLFTTPLEAPAGSKIESLAWYDNSAANRFNPDSTKEVHWGDQTWEEMQYTGLLISVPRRTGAPLLRSRPGTPRAR